jgi:hypothetical protein
VGVQVIFVVSDDLKAISKIEPGSFVDLNIWERAHIQEWVRTHPEILGEDLLIVSMEFDKFAGSSDRLDLLALDREANLVVVELKRNASADYADLQTIRYAAMVSSMTIEQLLPYHMAYQEKFLGLQNVSKDDSRAKITNFVEVENIEELTSQPRIILCSENFSRQVTTTVLWLGRFGIDISCVRITPYQYEGKVIIVPTKIIPLPEVDEYLTEIQQKEEQRQESQKQYHWTIKLLLENGILKAGDTIFLKRALPSYAEAAYDEADPRFRATITGKLGQQDAVRWEHDGQEYSISRLTRLIFKELDPTKAGPAGGINGNGHWENGTGKTLWELRSDFLGKSDGE